MFKKTGKNKRVLSIVSLLLISLFLIGTISAYDVGYILKSKAKVDKNIVSVFNEMGLTYELILDSKIKNYDLSKYRFIFIDNTRLTNTRKIPVYNYPSVIMNGYHGVEWGLTDNDGLSQLSADQPLNVKLSNNGLEQVYTKAQVNGKYLYYYYLDDKNSNINNLQTIARTWTGNIVTNDIGDVILVAPKGTVLMNGAITRGDLCFYGITNTKYWTNDARELFKECINRISLECSNDNECDPDKESEFYCKDGNVYRNFTNFYCQNPGTVSSKCESNIISELNETCEYGCENGECLPQCTLDSQCNQDFYSDNYCLNNSVFHDFHDFSCENEKCKEEITKQIAEECAQLCENGECKNITCSMDLDCNDNNIYTYDECNNPGTTNSYCTNTPVNCVTNNDCGITGFIGTEFCSSDDVYKLFQNSTCFDPGLKTSYCDVSIEQTLVNDCGNSFCSNYSENYCKNGDVYHSRTCNEKGCLDGACFSTNNEEESLVIECENGCSDGICLDNKIHDVGFIDFTGSIDKIKIENLSGKVLGADDNLECNNQYKIYVDLKNKGDFTENITFNGNIDGLILNHNPKNNLAPNDTTLRYKTININLSSGTYNVTVNAVIISDENPSDNIVTRQIKVICSNCVDEDEDGYDTCSSGDGGDDGKPKDCDDNNANVNPNATEICNGIDDNCDGIIDEGCQCINGDTKRCGSSDIGECEYGLQTCSNGKWGECVGNIEPSNEICDLKDNNCNGVVDENNGDCEQGKVCVDGECKKITCNFKLDCGKDGYVGDLFCESNGIYQNYQTFKCNNPGSYNSYCNNSIIPELVEQCSENQLCSNAKCEEIECLKDSDCDDNNYFTIDQCHNPGTIDSYCTNEPMNCKKNSDCGRDGWTGDLFCSSNNVFQNFISYKCNNPGTSDSYCSHNTNSKLVEECESGQVCANGQCKGITCYKDSECDDGNLYTHDECNNPGTADSYCSHDFVNCVTNNDCGPTGFIGSEICAENDVMKYFQNSTCINPGTMMSYCEISITQKLIKDCGDSSCNDYGENYCKNGDVYHSRTCNEKGCLDGACFEKSSTQEELVTECENGCGNGICTEECSKNSDCGIESYSDNYCENNSVLRKHFIPKCLNSKCSIQEIIETLEICPQGCENGSCVSGIHDVALVDFTNSVNRIRLETLNGTNILDTIPVLKCGDTIKAKVKILNNGEFSENVMIKGNVDEINFTFSNADNLTSGSSTYRSALFPYIKLNLPSGLYNLMVNAQIPIDSNPSDNSATRQIKIVCPECEKDEDCPGKICVDGKCVQDNCQEADMILNSIYSKTNSVNDYFKLDQAKTSVYCNNNDILLAGAGTLAQCSNSSTLACNYNPNYEFNGPNSNGWQSFYSLESQNRFYDTVREEVICLPTGNVSKYFSVYIRTAGSGSDKYSLDQNNTLALCDSGDKVISGGGYAPFCDASNPACGKKQYLENNEPVIVGNQEGWTTKYDIGSMNSIYDTVQTFAICLKKTALFDSKFKIYSVVNSGSNAYDLDQNKTTAFCNMGDIAIGGGGYAPSCDYNGDLACNKKQYLEFNGKITNGNQQGWQTFIDLTGNSIYDTESTSVTCLGIADSCL